MRKVHIPPNMQSHEKTNLWFDLFNLQKQLLAEFPEEKLKVASLEEKLEIDLLNSDIKKLMRDVFRPQATLTLGAFLAAFYRDVTETVLSFLDAKDIINTSKAYPTLKFSRNLIVKRGNEFKATIARAKVESLGTAALDGLETSAVEKALRNEPPEKLEEKFVAFLNSSGETGGAQGEEETPFVLQVMASRDDQRPILISHRECFFGRSLLRHTLTACSALLMLAFMVGKTREFGIASIVFFFVSSALSCAPYYRSFTSSSSTRRLLLRDKGTSIIGGLEFITLMLLIAGVVTRNDPVTVIASSMFLLLAIMRLLFKETKCGFGSNKAFSRNIRDDINSEYQQLIEPDETSPLNVNRPQQPSVFERLRSFAARSFCPANRGEKIASRDASGPCLMM